MSRPGLQHYPDYNTMKQTLTIEGMSCGHCVSAVKEALGSLEGVRIEEVQIGHAVVETGSDSPSEQAFRTAIEEEGFQLMTVKTVR